MKKQIRIKWTGKRLPNPAERRAIARAARAGQLHDGDTLAPGRIPHAAVSAYERFHWGLAPRRTSRVKLPSYSQGLYELGKLRKVEYETRKGRELATWVHPFSRPFPTLTATPSGKLGPILGGAAFVTSRGIER